MATATDSIDIQTSRLRSSAKRTRELFAEDFASVSALSKRIKTAYTVAPDEPTPQDLLDRINVSTRIRSEYANLKELPAALEAKQQAAAASAAARRKGAKAKAQDHGEQPSDGKLAKMIEHVGSRNAEKKQADTTSTALALRANGTGRPPPNAHGPTPQRDTPATSLVRRDTVRQLRPEWHAPWKLMRVISGSLGWVRSLAVEPGNQWFASGAGDRTIKLWDLASGTLKLTLTGHISTVRGLAVDSKHPYLFSCGEDKMVKCWDLETNKVIRHYHGHLSGVYTLALHPNLDVLMTGGRDGVVRVWDMRTRSNVMVLSGHKGTISQVLTQEADPQVISSSLDSTVRLWDLAASKTSAVLTHHKKGVRALCSHPTEFTFASASTGSIKQFKCPEGSLMQNFEAGQNSIINSLSVNEDNVMFSGGDDGSVGFWDWKTGHKFQSTDSIAQPGSLDAEAGVMSSTFDRTGLRLITGDADKTIKVWREDEDATPESHPLTWQPTMGRRKY